MGFILDGLQEDGYDRRYRSSVLLVRMLRHMRPRWMLLLCICLLAVGCAIMDISVRVFVARGIDALVDNITYNRAVALSAAIMIAAALSWTFNYFRQLYSVRIVGDMVRSVQEDVFQRVMRHDRSFYDENATGKIISRITSDTQSFANVATLFLDLLAQSMLLILLISILCYIDPILAGLTAVIVPAIVLAALGFRKLARRFARLSQRARGTLNANIQESLSGIMVVKSYRKEEISQKTFSDNNAQAYHSGLRLGVLFSGLFPFLFTVTGLGTIIVVYFGGLATANERISPGEWFLFVETVLLFWIPVTSIASFWDQLQLGLSAGERIFSLVDSKPNVVQTGNRAFSQISGKIEFKDLSFSYNQQEEVFVRFNMTVQAGRTVALVGHSGSGKSTVGKLIARFYEFQEGELLIDDRDIRTYDMLNLRRHIGIVPQIPFLFSNTVKENIRYGMPEATDAQVESAAAMVGREEWLSTLPDGLQTHVGELGKNLSLGQRQLVALARVILQDPAILVLDEATASVDPITESQIQETLQTVFRNRTAIVIAHRLTTITNADQIFVLSKGQIVEEGTHLHLIDMGGEYVRLYDTYFRHQSPFYEALEGLKATS